jgi:hypothetical protein
MNGITVNVPEDQWTPIGEPDPLTRLLVPLHIVGQCSLHLEARQVRFEDGEAVFVEYPEDLDTLFELYSADKGFTTYQAFGRQYVLFAVPYGR